MKYRYEIIKNDEVSDEEYENAFRCSVASVESILYDYNVDVTTDLASIYISQNKNSDEMPFLLQQCNDLIKDSFINAAGNLVEEFKGIALTEIKDT